MIIDKFTVNKSQPDVADVIDFDKNIVDIFGQGRGIGMSVTVRRSTILACTKALLRAG